MAVETNQACEEFRASGGLLCGHLQSGHPLEAVQTDSWNQQIRGRTWRHSVRIDDLWQAYLAYGWMASGGITLPSPGECDLPGFVALCRLAAWHHRSIERVLAAQQAREGLRLLGNRSLLSRPVETSVFEHSQSTPEAGPRAMGQPLRKKALYLAIRWHIHGEHPELLPVAFGYTADWFLGLRALEGADRRFPSSFIADSSSLQV